MPFVEVIWKPDRMSTSRLKALCDELPGVVAETFTTHDPAHLVTEAMVDLRVTTVGPYDRVNPDLYVTVLARTEPARDAGKTEIVRGITEAVRRLEVPADVLVELVLTNRVSLYDYGELL
jgi:hypothetical protein